MQLYFVKLPQETYLTAIATRWDQVLKSESWYYSRRKTEGTQVAVTKYQTERLKQQKIYVLKNSRGWEA